MQLGVFGMSEHQPLLDGNGLMLLHSVYMLYELGVTSIHAHAHHTRSNGAVTPRPDLDHHLA
jgi:hypothetical protein